MEKKVLLVKFTYPSEMVAIRGRLEAEGIECFVRDELTVQVHNFLSGAIGGIRLEVKQSDHDRGKQILQDIGFFKDKVQQRSKLWEIVARWTDDIPIIKNLRLELRLILSVAFLLTLLLFTIFGVITMAIRQPEQNTYDYLTKNSWCLSHITYMDKNYVPNTISENEFKIIFENMCNERMYIDRNSTLTIPGFKSVSIQGVWRLEGDTLVFDKLSSLGHIFQGTYRVQREPLGLALQSDNTTIYCYNDL